MKKFLNSIILEKIFYIFFILFSALSLYHLVILVLIKVSCSYFHYILHGVLFMAALSIGVISVFLAISQLLKWILQKNKKKIIIFSIIVFLFLFLLWFIIITNAFYCFLSDFDVEPLFDWFPH